MWSQLATYSAEWAARKMTLLKAFEWAGMPAIHYRTPHQLAADLAARGVLNAPRAGHVAVL